VRSHRSALAYWSAWLQLRYGQALGDAPLPPAVAIQFVLDHLARPLADVRKKSAIVIESLQALLDTCSDGICGVRDRALLLLAWSGGGRRW
jgi:site-specific recombinase XerC